MQKATPFPEMGEDSNQTQTSSHQSCGVGVFVNQSPMDSHIFWVSITSGGDGQAWPAEGWEGLLFWWFFICLNCLFWSPALLASVKWTWLSSVAFSCVWNGVSWWQLSACFHIPPMGHMKFECLRVMPFLQFCIPAGAQSITDTRYSMELWL